MRLEHKNKKVLPLKLFIFRLFRYFMFASCLILFSLCIGIFGYRYFAGLSWVDSFHMASMILTGMGPVIEMNSPGSKLFSSFYALYSGIAFLSTTAVLFAPIVHRLLHILHAETDQFE